MTLCFNNGEQDEGVYHESLVHPAMVAHERGAERVAIIGGGEGGTLREVLKYSSVREAVMIELDQGVMDMCKKHLPEMNDCSWINPPAGRKYGDPWEEVDAPTTQYV